MLFESMPIKDGYMRERERNRTAITSTPRINLSFAGKSSDIRKHTQAFFLFFKIAFSLFKIETFPWCPRVPRTTPKTFAPRAFVIMFLQEDEQGNS